jgi:sec-independent protein translocase protein TatB
MLSLPHLVVLFVIALVIFGPEKLPELARMLGKATAEFRKITTDFRYALEDEVRDLERQTRIREEEIATAARAVEPPPVPPQGTLPRELPAGEASAPTAAEQSRLDDADPARPEAVSASHEKPSDDTAV